MSVKPKLTPGDFYDTWEMDDHMDIWAVKIRRSPVFNTGAYVFYDPFGSNNESASLPYNWCWA
jgi:hypothetical protein